MLHIVQLAHSVGECILQCGGSDALFPNYFVRTCYNYLINSDMNVSGCTLYSYQLAPEAVFPAAFDDCIKATKYFMTNAAQFHVNPHHIAVAGNYILLLLTRALK